MQRVADGLGGLRHLDLMYTVRRAYRRFGPTVVCRQPRSACWICTGPATCRVGGAGRLAGVAATWRDRSARWRAAAQLPGRGIAGAAAPWSVARLRRPWRGPCRSCRDRPCVAAGGSRAAGLRCGSGRRASRRDGHCSWLASVPAAGNGRGQRRYGCNCTRAAAPGRLRTQQVLRAPPTRLPPRDGFCGRLRDSNATPGAGGCRKRSAATWCCCWCRARISPSAWRRERVRRPSRQRR